MYFVTFCRQCYLSVDGFLFTTNSKGDMPHPILSPSQVCEPERQPSQKGFDLPRIYRALIKGFIRAKTNHKLSTETPEQEK